MSAAELRTVENDPELRELVRSGYADQARRAGILFPSDLAEYRPPASRVAGLLPETGLVLAFGASSSGKTTLVVDLCASIALGTAWRGRAISGGGGLVVYFAIENPSSVRMRARALCLREPDTARAPLAITAGPLSLGDSDLVDAAIGQIRLAERASGRACVVAVVDTLAAAMPGLDENSARDMGVAIAALARIRDSIGAPDVHGRCAGGLVVAVHHSGKSSENGARGSSALRAAVDVELEVTGQIGTRLAKVTKARDYELGAEFAFDLEPITIATIDGEPVSSVAVRHRLDSPPPVAAPVKARGRNQQHATAALREWCRAHPGETHVTTMELRDLLKAQGVTVRQRMHESLEYLVGIRAITPAVGGYTVDSGAL